MPIITLEVMPDSSIVENVPYDSFYPTQSNNIFEDIKDQNDPFIEKNDDNTGMHFLVDKSEETEHEQNSDQNGNSGNFNLRSDLTEYMTRSDGSVCCKICGKILASRSHWYRHKYRAHVIHPGNPAPLFQCEQCLIYFKSRKGYIGHIASKHSETLQDASPVLTNAQAEALAREKSIIQPNLVQAESIQIDPVHFDPTQPHQMEVEVKKEPDPELSIPKTIVPTFQNAAVKQTHNRSTETPHRKTTRSSRQGVPRSPEHPNQNEQEWKEKRSREEKLVSDIIARVRRECEAQGSGGSTRRGYSRKPLHT